MDTVLSSGVKGIQSWIRRYSYTQGLYLMGKFDLHKAITTGDQRSVHLPQGAWKMEPFIVEKTSPKRSHLNWVLMDE